MDVKAKVKYIRISPRKVRLVLDAVRGLNVETALAKMAVMNKKAARTVTKLLTSAIANAEHNFKLKKEDLVIKTIVADEGPTLKRWRARAFGRAAMIRKRTSHILIVLTDGKEEKPEEKKVKADEKVKTEKKEEKKEEKKSGLDIIEKDEKKKVEKKETKTTKTKVSKAKKPTSVKTTADRETKKSEKPKK